MNLWKKLGTLIRAGASEPAEKLVDANAIRIMQQELRDTQNAMAGARAELARLMAERKRLLRSNEALEASLAHRNEQAREALQKQEEALARELAEQIAEDEASLAEQRAAAEAMAVQEKQLRQRLREAASTLKRYQRDMALVHANRNAQKVIGRLGSSTTGLSNHMGDLAESMASIRDQQSRFFDEDAARRELDEEDSGRALDSRLKAAGIGADEPGVEQVLARLRAELGEEGLGGSAGEQRA